MFLRFTPARGTRRRAALMSLAVLALALGACSSPTNAASPTTAASRSSGPVSQATSQSAEHSSMSMPTSSDPASSGSASSQVPSGSASEPPAADPAPVPAAPIANAVTIETPGMRYDVTGKLHPGVAAITLTNSDDEAHMMAVARLKKGVTLKEVTKALAAGEQAAGPLLADGLETSYGTPDLLGAGLSETVTATDLPAGNYALICFLTDAKGMPHWQMGMVDLISVAGQKATEKPASDGTITLDDKGITLPDGFTGHGTYLVSNTGKAVHNISIAGLEPGTKLLDYYQHVGQAMNGSGQVDGGGGVVAGGIDALAPGQSAYLTLDLVAGHYAYLSTADATGPDLPAQHGEFDIS